MHFIKKNTPSGKSTKPTTIRIGDTAFYGDIKGTVVSKSGSGEDEKLRLTVPHGTMVVTSSSVRTTIGDDKVKLDVNVDKDGNVIEDKVTVGDEEHSDISLTKAEVDALRKALPLLQEFLPAMVSLLTGESEIEIIEDEDEIDLELDLGEEGEEGEVEEEEEVEEITIGDEATKLKSTKTKIGDSKPKGRTVPKFPSNRKATNPVRVGDAKPNFTYDLSGDGNKGEAVTEAPVRTIKVADRFK